MGKCSSERVRAIGLQVGARNGRWCLGGISSVERMSSRPKEERGGMDLAANTVELVAGSGGARLRVAWRVREPV